MTAFLNHAVIGLLDILVDRDGPDLVGDDMPGDRVLDVRNAPFDVSLYGAVLESTVAFLVEGTVLQDEIRGIAKRLLPTDMAVNESDIVGVPCQVLSIQLTVIDRHVVTFPERVFRRDLGMVDLHILAVLKDVFGIAGQPIHVDILAEHEGIGALMELYVLQGQSVDPPEGLVSVRDLDIFEVEVFHFPEELRTVDDGVFHLHVIGIPDCGA